MSALAAAPGPEIFAGCLIGQALGDALGFVVEGQPPDACRAYVEGVVKAGHAARGRRGPFAFGQYSDDSQLARELLQSYVARGGFEAADYARRVAAIFAEERIVGPGQSTGAAARRLAAGVPWAEAGTPPPSAGNGSAMRAGPIGLLFHDDPERLIAAAHDQGRLTHADPRCSAGAVAIAGAVALALDAAPLDRAAFLGTLAEWAGAIEPFLAAYLEDLTGWVALSPDEAVKRIAGAGVEPGFGEPWPGISPFVVPSVLWSLYAFLRTPDDYWEAVCAAIAVGGDVDTTAAMTGAIAGARAGLKALPADLTSRLNDQGTWGFEALAALARHAWEIKAQA